MKLQALLRMLIGIPGVIVAMCCVPGRTLCQPSAQEQTKVVTIREAVDLALDHYPAVQAALARARAARAGIAAAETAYLPRADLIWQENRATDNNVTGLVLPQSVLPSISGPVKESTSWSSAWGSAAGTLLSWEPFDFGRRQATVDVAQTLTAQANARADITRLDVSVAAADAFLTSWPFRKDRVQLGRTWIGSKYSTAPSAHSSITSSVPESTPRARTPSLPSRATR